MIYSEACSCGAKFHIEENSDRVERIDELIDDWREAHVVRCDAYKVRWTREMADPYGYVFRGPAPDQPPPPPGVATWTPPATAYEVVNGWPEVTGRAE